MDNRPIGVMDSGVGGLTCINALKEALPNESIIYFGDTARAPYGSKSSKTICDFSLQIADFLIKNGVKAIIIACNTITAAALVELQKAHPNVPIQGIIVPSAEELARDYTPENSIGVISTMQTTQSRAYENALNSIKGGMNVHSQACPAFVPLIEEGAVDTDTIRLTAHNYLDGFISQYKIDTLVLGCTHYPIIRSVIEEVCPNVKIVDPAFSLAIATKNLLKEKDSLADKKEFKDIYYASDLSQDFINMIDRLGITGDFELQQHRF